MVARISTPGRKPTKVKNPFVAPIGNRKPTTDSVASGLAIKRVAIATLREYPTNARLHGEHNLDSIAASLTRHGQVEPLVVQLSTRYVIGGNGRLRAMLHLGWSECDIVELDIDDVQAKALSLTLNQTGLSSSWDGELVLTQIDDLSAEGIEFGELGFTQIDLDVIKLSLEPTKQPEPPNDDERPITETTHECPKCGHQWSGEAKRDD